uniref:DUF3179 domain-containing protein n=1 Tax=uncultured Thiotrichaceae bacterium TaxID=298394 RepID=A0A6S6TXA7_9GAMM|nr:MAG: Unknown protein [uncultured Thiotrichaceae bacterium]
MKIHALISSFSRRCVLSSVMFLCLLTFAVSPVSADSHAGSSSGIAGQFLGLLGDDVDQQKATLKILETQWHPGFVPMILELYHIGNNPQLTRQLMDILRKKTGQTFGNNLDEWYRWIWRSPENRHPEYAEFKARLYELIDPRFANYFSGIQSTDIRLDEVRWGGVMQDGIPPLRSPKMIPASQAGYLGDTDVVFGVSVNGDERAYPKRILAWHEMFTDTIGGTDFAGVYCTLCGSVVLYETRHKGKSYQLGTSGFLYRSNKLMYDKGTQSLWSTTWGKPVIGALVGKGIELGQDAVVTTTWGEWKRRHPESTVLSLDTGYERNYGEGVAYQDYFATQKLMFAVPETDGRLQNKDEVLALSFPGVADTLAIDANYLKKNSVHNDKVGSQALVVLTDASGANRVYDSGGIQFKSYDADKQVMDVQGNTWAVGEDALTGANGQKLKRLAARRAFWFGWYAAYNDTRLVK